MSSISFSSPSLLTPAVKQQIAQTAPVIKPAPLATVPRSPYKAVITKPDAKVTSINITV